MTQFLRNKQINLKLDQVILAENNQDYIYKYFILFYF
jgi:hypothetical protein